jgi:hypothetical protein
MRKTKLGDDYDRLLSTSLGSPKEMDALIRLIEHRPIFKALVERAIAGGKISAIAVCEDIKTKGLVAACEEFMTPTPPSPPLPVTNEASKRPGPEGHKKERELVFNYWRTNRTKKGAPWRPGTVDILTTNKLRVEDNTLSYWRKQFNNEER